MENIGWFDWVSLTLTIAAFLFAGWQAWEAKTMAKEAKRASEVAASELNFARDRLHSEQLASLVPHLKVVISDLDYSIDKNNGEVAQRALVRFSAIADEATGLMKINSEQDELLVKLTAVSGAALDMKAKIATQQKIDIPRWVKPVYRQIVAIDADLVRVSTTNRFRMKGREDV